MMTCIVGLIHKRRVYIGGDSAGVAGSELAVRKDPKVFRKGAWLIGYTSSFRMGQLLRYRLTIPRVPVDVSLEEFMTTTFIDAVRSCFKEGGILRKDNDVESGGDFLVGYGGRLFHVASDFQVGENVAPFDATGCGRFVALGALWATQDSNLPPEERVERALMAAWRFNTDVRPPFVIESVDNHFSETAP